VLTPKRIVLLAVILGAIIRVIYLIWSHALPFWDYPITDALYHHRWAEAIASGLLWDGEPFFRAPFYPYVLGGLYALFGSQVVVGKVFGHVVGLATGTLIMLLAGRLWGRDGILWSAILWLGSGLLLFFEGELLVDSLFTGLTFASLYCLFTSDESRNRTWLSGLLFGLAVITRPTLLVCLPVYVAWAYSHRTPRRGRLWVAWSVATLLPILPVVALNTVALERPAGIATQGGINFYIAHNTSADGYTAVLPEPWGYAWTYHALAAHAGAQSGRTLDPAEVSSHYYGEGWEFIRNHPAQTFDLSAKKILLSVGRLTISNNLNLPYVTDQIKLLKWLGLRVAMLVILAVAGLAWVRREPREVHALWLTVLCYSTVFVLFFVNERFRLPLVPVWIVLSTGTLAGIRQRTMRQHIKAAVLALGTAIVILPNWYGLRPDNQAMAYFNLGNVALRQGDNERAEVLYDSALTFDPYLHQLYLNRGLSHLRQSHLDLAQRDFLSEARLHPSDGRPYNNLAALFLLTGDTTAALDAIDEGLRRDSSLGLLYLQRMHIALAWSDTASLNVNLNLARRWAHDWPLWHYWTGELLRLEGRFADARRNYDLFAQTRAVWPALGGEDRTFAGPSSAMLAYKNALSYLYEGDLESAERGFAQAAKADSAFAEAWINWGTAAASKGDFESARARYLQALAIDENTPVVWTNLAWSFLNLGFPDSATVALKRALAIDSLFEPALVLNEQLDARSPQ
jgi:tetratricopeptide (TPR) repeat protein